jgi:hypothetical protein
MADLETLVRSIRSAATRRRTAAQCKPLVGMLAASFAALGRRDREVLLMAAVLGDTWNARPCVPALAWLLANGVSPATVTNGNNTYPTPKGVPLLAALAMSFDHPESRANESPAAVRKNNVQVEAGIIAMLEGGAKPDVVTRQGVSPLHHAADHGALRAMRALIAHGADLEARDKWGSTPLFYAARSDVVPAVKLLLDAGAKLARDRDGDTPYDQAIAYGATRTAALLQKRCKAPAVVGNATISAADITRLLARLAKTRHSIRAMAGKPDPAAARFVRGGKVAGMRIVVRLDVAKLPALARSVRHELVTALGNEAKLWLAQHGVNTSAYNTGPAEPWYVAAGSKSTKRAEELFAAMRRRS